MDSIKTDVFSLFIDGREVAKVPRGNLENVLSCILISVDSVNISLVPFEI